MVQAFFYVGEKIIGLQPKVKIGMQG